MDQTSTDLLIKGVGAFAGAFFAYLFLRIGDFFSRLYQRQLKHYNSLVILEIQLNELSGIIHDNLYILPQFRSTILSGKIYFNNLHTLPIDKTHYENLYNADIKNDLFEYYCKLRKLSDDISTITLGYLDIKNAFTQKHITDTEYLINTKNLANNLRVFEAFLAEIQDDTVRFLAKVKVRIKYDIPLGTKWQFKLFKTSKMKEKDIEKEEAKLKEEIEESKTSSQKEIEEILKKNGLIK